MHLGVSVVIEDPEKLEAIRKRYSESLDSADENKHQVEVTTNFAIFNVPCAFCAYNNVYTLHPTTTLLTHPHTCLLISEKQTSLKNGFRKSWLQMLMLC